MNRTYKDSGVDWVGQIPEDWEMKRLKVILEERNEKNDPVQTEFILSLGASYGIIPYSEKTGGGNKAKEDYSAYKLAYPGDIVMNSMNIISGSVGLSKYFGCVSPVYYMLHPRDDSTNVEYYYMMFQTRAFQRSLLGLGNGILMKESSNGNFNTVRMRIPISKLNALMLPSPSPGEQEKIARYLTNQCDEIDSLMKRTLASIEEYIKLKQTIITNATTKGLRANVKMKASGIEWVEEIPENWEVLKFKYLATDVFKGAGITKEDVKENGEIPCVRYGEIYTQYNFHFDECKSRTNEDCVSQPRYFSYGDILFTCTGELVEEIGKAIVYLGNEKCMAGGDIIVARHKQNPIFMSYALNSNYAQSQRSHGKAKLKVVHASAYDINNTIMVMPPIEEQEEIATYLDEKCTEIDSIIEAKELLAKELELYKKSLIYEYVTGKRRVVD